MHVRSLLVLGTRGLRARTKHPWDGVARDEQRGPSAPMGWDAAAAVAPNKGAGRREGEDAALVQGRCWWLVTGAGPGTPPWWHGCSPNHCALGPATCPCRAQHPPELSQPWPRTAQHHQHQPGETRKPHTKLNKAANLSRPQFCPHHAVSHSGDDFLCVMPHAHLHGHSLSL